MKNSYLDLFKNKQPIFALAPMEDVTDTVFRRLILSISKPDLVFTEFTSSEGLNSPGREKISHRLKFYLEEKPIIAQIWGKTPKAYFEAAKIITKMGFDGVDINMGCPVKKVIKHGSCSALINNPSLAKEIFLATKEGVKNKIPVSIKTRIGFDKIVTRDWIGFILQELKPPLLTIHGRTVKELSKVPNHWDEIGLAVKMRDCQNLQTFILGNGDVSSHVEAVNLTEKYSLDGVMIGRGVFHNPWIFNPEIDFDKITVQQKINLLQKHLQLWHAEWKIENSNPIEYSKNYSELKRFFKIYIQGFENAASLRQKLMTTKNCLEALEYLS